MAPVFLVGAARLGCRIVLGKAAYLMFHNFSGGFRGKGHEVYTHIKFYKDWASKMDRSILYPFLMSCELDYMISGGDLYFNKEEAEKRFGILGKFVKGTLTKRQLQAYENKAQEVLTAKIKECV